MSKQNKVARTFMPEIIAPGTGLSPVTKKSIIPTNNVHTIEDVLNGKPYKIPGGGGDWSDGEEAQTPSYKEDAEVYRRRERANEMLSNLGNYQQGDEKWKVKVDGGWKIFPSFSAANAFIRRMRDKGVHVPWATRTASVVDNSFIQESLNKSFMIESFNYDKNVKDTGSCFCIEKNYFLTCAHVVMRYNKNTESRLDFSQYQGMIKLIINYNGKKIPAEVVKFDGVRDIALLYADIECDKFEFDKNYKVGEKVFTVGSPHGFENNATFGNISAVNRQIYSHQYAPEYMFIDVSVLPGNSGGPVINSNNGKVVGMVTAIIGDGNLGLNSALEVKYILDFCYENGFMF